MTVPAFKPELSKALPNRGPQLRAKPTTGIILTTLAFVNLLLAATGTAAEFFPFPGDAHSNFGTNLGISGTTALAGASGVAVYHGHTPYYSQGAAYGIRNLNTDNEPSMFKFTAHDGATWDQFGRSVSISNGYALVGANNAVYWYKNLDIGSPTQVLKITNPGAEGNFYAGALSLSNNIAIVTAPHERVGTNSFQGVAYLTRMENDVVSGTARLLASDGRNLGFFGQSVSVSGNKALVGANPGVYLFTNLDTAAGDITQFAKLTSTKGSHNNSFGVAVSLDGAIGLVGANYANYNGNAQQGVAYLYRNLGSQTGNISELATLIASDGGTEHYFGGSLGISGSVGIIGSANATINGQTNHGAAYLYTNLDTATGTRTESIKITSSTGMAHELFGYSVAISGDNFVIGSMGSGIENAADKVYSGSVESMSTLDRGNAYAEIDAISFQSRVDWIIGQTTDANEVRLTSGDSAEVLYAGKAVYIGMEAGANYNTLVVEGTVVANAIHIGAIAGNEGNSLRLGSSASLDVSTIFLALDNVLSIQGEYTDIADLFFYLDDIDLQVWDETDQWVSIDLLNFEDYLTSSFSDGYSHFRAFNAIPEPSSIALTGLTLGALFSISRWRGWRVNA